MSLKTTYAVLWIAWIVAFFVIEFSALWSGHAELTLSDFTWRLEKLGKAWTVVHYFLTAFLAWLFFHIAWGLFR